MRTIHMVAGAIMGVVLCTPGIAAAANAFTTGNVNMRAGPSTYFPRIAVLPEGVTVDVYGCLDGWSWCDTGWQGFRGWVSGAYLELLYRGRRELVPYYGAVIGLPIISFNFGSYWDRWYWDYPWYEDRPRWRRSWERDDWSWLDSEPSRDRPRVRRGDGGGERLRRSDGGGAGASMRRSEEARPRNGSPQLRNARPQVQRESARGARPDQARSPATGEGRRVIRKKGGKGCPPGLQKQGRC